MLKEQAKLFNRMIILIDMAIIIVSFRCSYAVASKFLRLGAIDDYLLILVLFLLIGLYLFRHYGVYSSLRTRSLFDVLGSLLKAHVIGAILVAAGIYLYQQHGLSRGFFILFLSYSYVLLALEKLALKILLGIIRKKGYNFRNILIVGTGEKSEQFAKYVFSKVSWGMRVVGFLTEPDDAPRESFLGYKVLGRLQDLVKVCRTHTVDEVIFCISKDNVADIESYLRDMEELGITVRMTLNFHKQRRTKHEVVLLENEIPVMTFYRQAFDPDKLFLKRCLDIAGAVVGLALTAVLFPFVALAIMIDSPGPVFFGQKRVGENGRTFTCWKFRSMTEDAEVLKEGLLAMNEVNGAMFKIKNDPRMTRVGKFLRKSSLDELPQFWNVLKGEMSLVGTRPPTTEEVKTYENWHRRRICIRPGMTGLWQVSGRNEIKDFDEIVKLDLTYVDNWTLMFDIKLILKTFMVIFTGSGSR